MSSAITKVFAILSGLMLLLLALSTPAFARDLQYGGDEAVIHVRPGEPTQVTFPGKIEGGFKRDKNSNIVLERQNNFLVVFSRPQLGLEGESLIVHLEDSRSYALRIVPATGSDERDVSVKIIDTREPDMEELGTASIQTLPSGEAPEFAPPSTISGLMREMVLAAEFGKQKGVAGYRRSNRYTGETVLSDGTIIAYIDEIFMGTDLWGYVLSVENKLDVSQRINPATFRLDGTRAVSASNWELAPNPKTEEQKIAREHKSRVYIITKAKRR
jgi:hypothetical protein